MARRRSHAHRLQAVVRSRATAPRMRTGLSWGAAALLLVALAFIVGRPGTEAGILSGSPSPTPTPPLPIIFGGGLDPDTNVAIDLTGRFRPGEPFAYSVTLTTAPGTDTILVEVARVVAGVRTVVQEPSVQKILPEAQTFAFQVQTDDLLAAWGPGDYEMRIFFDAAEPALAAGAFTLVEAPPPAS
jgi:hypothetical protein